MSKKQKLHCPQCGGFLNGNKCPECHFEFRIERKKFEEKRDFRKKVLNFGKSSDMWFKFGVLCLFLFGALTWSGINYLFIHGLQSFNMGMFTLIVILGLLGVAITFGGKKRA